MPQVIENEDGTRTLMINSSELRVLTNLLAQGVPEVKKVRRIVNSPDVAAVLRFVKATLA
jgi:hypothetical protein